MKSYSLPWDIYREFLLFILVELIALNLLAALFHLYRSPALGTSVLLIVAFNCVIASLFYRIRILRQQLFNSELEKQRCRFIEGELQSYRKHRHDMKNHLLVIHELARLGHTEELQDYVANYSDSVLKTALISVQTGSEELDILIISKIESARSRGITFQFTSSSPVNIGARKIPMAISLFSNLLDNALEAAEAVEDPDNRLVILHIYDDPLDTIAVLTNTFPDAQTPNLQRLFKEGYSQKSPDRGRGLSIVQNIIGRLEGQLKVDLYQEKFFQVKVELPKHRLV